MFGHFAGVVQGTPDWQKVTDFEAETEVDVSALDEHLRQAYDALGTAWERLNQSSWDAEEHPARCRVDDLRNAVDDLRFEIYKIRRNLEGR